MHLRTFLAAVVALSAATLSAQVGGGRGGAAPGTTPATGTGGLPSAPTSGNPGSSGASKTPDIGRAIYISGKVVTQDGAPAPSDVTIQRICSGVSHTVAFTDSHGRFSFQWNDRNAIVSDASDAGSNRNPGASGGFGSAQLASGADPFGSRMANCELRANLAGYTSDMIDLFNRRLTDNPDIGIIVLHRVAGVEGASISATSLMAPKDARKAYEHGLKSLAGSKPEDAAKDFEKAVSLYPKYADAWANLGKMRAQQQSFDAARAALAKAIECDPKLVVPYLELGLLSARESKWQESGNYLDRALKLDPVDYPQAWYTDAVANYNLKKYDAAEKAAREAVRLDPKHVNPRSEYLLGLILAENQDFAGAAEELQNYVRQSPNAPDLAAVQDQLGQLEKLKTQTKPAPVTPRQR